MKQKKEIVMDILQSDFFLKKKLKAWFQPSCLCVCACWKIEGDEGQALTKCWPYLAYSCQGFHKHHQWRKTRSEIDQAEACTHVQGLHHGNKNGKNLLTSSFLPCQQVAAQQFCLGWPSVFWERVNYFIWYEILKSTLTVPPLYLWRWGGERVKDILK